MSSYSYEQVDFALRENERAQNQDRLRDTLKSERNRLESSRGRLCDAIIDAACALAEGDPAPGSLLLDMRADLLKLELCVREHAGIVEEIRCVDERERQLAEAEDFEFECRRDREYELRRDGDDL